MLSRPPLRLGRINFVNVLPVHLRLEPRPGLFSLEPGVPSALNRRLRAGDLDLAAVSSVEYALHHEQYLILPGLGLSTQGPVESVLLFSERPQSEWAGGLIQAPFESDMSVMLTRVLLARTWGLDCRVADEAQAGEGKAPVAVLRIGDRALREAASGRWPLVWDLGRVWWEWTGLPLVYALWVARRQVAQERPGDLARMHGLLLAARDAGLAEVEACATEAARLLDGDPAFFRRYFTQLKYTLGSKEIEGLGRFYDELARTGQIAGAPALEFFGAQEPVGETSPTGSQAGHGWPAKLGAPRGGEQFE